MVARLPVCVIGAGAIGQRHIEVCTASEKVDLVAVVEPQDDIRNGLLDRGLPAVPDIDAVPAQVRSAIIATPTQLHASGSIDAIRRGWAVLVEKPVAATLDEARQMIAASDAAGLPLITGHHRRCHPFSLAARAELAKIGDLVGVQGLWSLRKHDSYYNVDWRRRPGAGPLMTNLTHELDLLRFFVGEITETSAMLSSARRGFVIEDTAALSFRFQKGALGSFLISDAGASPWAFEAGSHENPSIAGSDQDYLRFVGTEGALAFPSLTRWGRSGPGEVEWFKQLAKEVGPVFDRIDPLLAQVDRFAALVGGTKDDVLCTAEAGMAALEMTLAAALSGRTGRPVKAGEVPGDYRGA